MIVQLSRGRFPADRLGQVQLILEEAGAGLRQELRTFPGLLASFAGIDASSKTLVNVSIWDTLAHAQQLSGSNAWRTLVREPAEKAATTFEVFAHYPVSWSLADVVSEAGRKSAKAVRISKGDFTRERAEAVDNLMRGVEKELAAPIGRLPGLVGYYVGTDPATGTVTHISFWDSLAHAAQMSTLKEMLILREPAVALGIQFEPQINYPIVWST